MAKFLKVRGQNATRLLMGRSGLHLPKRDDGEPIPTNAVFYSNSGSNSNPGTVSEPFADWDYAHENCPVGYTVVALDGLYDNPTTPAYWYAPTGFARDVSNWQSRTAAYRLGVAGLRLFFIGSRYNNGADYTFSNLVADCTDGAGTTLAGRGFDIANNDVYQNFTLDNVSVIAPGAIAVLSSKRSGNVTIQNSTFIYDDLNNFVVGGANHADTGPAQWNVLNNTFEHTTAATLTVAELIGGVALVADAGQYTYNVSGNDIKLTIPQASQVPYEVIKPESALLSTVSNNRITLTSAQSSQVDVIIAVSDAGYPSPQVNLTDNVVRMYCSNGFGISLGGPSNDNYIQNGLIEGNTVIGQYYASSTPHLYDIGRCDATDRYICRNNIADRGFVGYLVSEGASAAASLTEDNLAFDCYGPSYYAKGNTDATIQNNRAILSDTYDQRFYGVLHAATQTGPNIDTQFTGNVVTVQDISKLGGGLAGFSSGDSATFTNNIYQIPDTVDLDTELLFLNGVGPSGADMLYADWLALPNVSGDTIQLKPQAEIDAIIAAAAAEVAAAS